MGLVRFFTLVAVATLACFQFENAHAEFVDIVRSDCQGVVHFFKNTPLETHLDAAFMKQSLEAFRARVKARVSKRCPSMGAQELNRRFVPSLDMAFNYLLGDIDRATATVCDETFSDDALDMGSFFALIQVLKECLETIDNYSDFGFTYLIANLPQATFINVAQLFPTSCTLDTWKNNGTCMMKLILSEFWASTEVLAAASSCGEDTAWPFIALQCAGEACKHAFQPCTADSHCGAGGKLTCQNIGSLFSAVDVADSLATVLSEYGLWHSSMPSSNIWEKLILPARKFWGSYYTPSGTGSVNGASSSDYFKFCLPPNSYQGHTGNTFIDIVDDVMYTKNTRDCSKKNGCEQGGMLVGTVYCAYPWSEENCDNAGHYIEKIFNFDNLFKTNDDQPFSPSFSTSNLFDEINSDALVLNMTIFGDNTFFGYNCHVATNGACNLGRIGDGWCDSACNVAACKHDGGDCVGPAEILTPSTVHTCPVRKALSASSPCIDSSQSCLSVMRNYELADDQGKLKTSVCSGSFSPYKTCCICNAQSVYENVATENMRTSISMIHMSVNVLYAWNGTLPTGGNILDLAPITTLWPPYSFTPGEARLLSLDCHGFAQFNLIAPLGRAYIPGPYAALQKLETVILDIAYLRQTSQSGVAAFVTPTTPRKLTKFGIMNYGFWTLGYVLWQFTPSIRNEPRETSFTTVGDTVGKLLQRDDNPHDDGLVVLDIPDSCSFNTWTSTGKCLLKYTAPFFTYVNYPITFNLGIQQCPNSHIPEVTVSAKGSAVDHFPFLMPCLQNSSCPTGSECLDIFSYAKNKPFSPSGKSLVDLEYDILTFFLHGRAGRPPKWTDAPNWATQDAIFVLKSLFGNKVSPNPYDNPPAFATGEMKLCFDLNDPFLRTIFKYGTPKNWTEVFENVEMATSTSVTSSSYTQPMIQIKANGLESSTAIPDGFGSTNTAPPTGAPTGPPTKKSNSTVPSSAIATSSNTGYSLMLGVCILLGLFVIF